MDLISLLRQDHDEIRSLYRKMTSAGLNVEEDSIRGLQETFTDLVVNHTRMEEGFLYPRLRQIRDAEDLVSESLEDHSRVDQMLQRLQRERSLSGDWKRLLDQLYRVLDHHIAMEENRLIPIVQRYFERDEMAEIYENMVQFRKENMIITEDIPVEPTL